MSEEKETNRSIKNDEQGSPTETSKKQSHSGGTKRPSGTYMPEINFATFIFSLNSSALVNLGMIDDPATGGKSKNLAMAKQTIDILAMLQEKTRGNLTNDEDNMLRSVLYDLRILYIKENA